MPNPLLMNDSTLTHQRVSTTSNSRQHPPQRFQSLYFVGISRLHTGKPPPSPLQHPHSIPAHHPRHSRGPIRHPPIITSFPRRRESGCAVLRRLSVRARSYNVPLAVRARRIVDPAATRRPPARKSRSSRPPDTPGPPALGSSSGGMGVGVGVAVAVGTGVRVGVIVGGGVGVGVLVSTMS